MVATHSLYLRPVRPASTLISILLLLRIVVCALLDIWPILAHALLVGGLQLHINRLIVDDCVVQSVYCLVCFCVGCVCHVGIALLLFFVGVAVNAQDGPVATKHLDDHVLGGSIG
jgi:hypothetical protein